MIIILAIIVQLYCKQKAPFAKKYLMKVMLTLYQSQWRN